MYINIYICVYISAGPLRPPGCEGYCMSHKTFYVAIVYFSQFNGSLLIVMINNIQCRSGVFINNMFVHKKLSQAWQELTDT